MFSSGTGKRRTPLALVPGGQRSREKSDAQSGSGGGDAPGRGLDWSILMAHAQAGEREAYRRLLEEITPYVRSLAARCHRNPSDVEDSVQDVLLTVHAVRHTYDPTRPFGPWLMAITNRRIADRLRRQGRAASRETALTDEHETFPAAEANYDETITTARALREAVECLPPGQRDAIKLLKLQEMSLKEAATASGMSVAALKVATHRAMKNLRKRFTKPGNDT